MTRRGYGYIKIGTWNVRGNLWQKKPELTNELKESQINIVALTGTKKKSQRVEEVDDGYTMFHDMIDRKVDLCVANDLIVANTFFPHKKIYQRQRCQVIDVRVGRAMEPGTDHYFLEVKMDISDGAKVANRNSKKRPVNNEPKFKINCKLRSTKVRREEFVQADEQEIAYQAEVLRKAGLVELWKAFKQVPLEVAEQTAPTSINNSNSLRYPSAATQSAIVIPPQPEAALKLQVPIYPG
ncbi:hypothetical protein ILUMI_00228 [Ignelater luminosus]|uniref:Uncharacterized protein n=1 Tax=Ignelater luminosus TaxID=2038154 RepID=A0A8K0DGU9_IGNLU|nr:hypothetical protein ILUMI_00228 [Ignelater luminosus]